MFTRTTGYLIVPAWIAAMGWLFAHDVLPGLTAGDPPLVRPDDWLRDDNRQAQYGIVGALGEEWGSIWTIHLVDEFSVQRHDLIWLERFPLPITPLRLTMDSTFTPEGLLDEFTVKLHNDNAIVELHGERFHADFSFKIDGWIGDRRLGSTFKVPLVEGGTLGGVFSPFGTLRDLSVGQSWRMQVFNPLSALVGVGDRFIPMLVRVTGEERLSTPQGSIPCFVVESPSARALVDDRGVVHQQEIRLPAIGMIRVIRQSGFDENAERAARRRSFPSPRNQNP